MLFFGVPLASMDIGLVPCSLKHSDLSSRLISFVKDSRRNSKSDSLPSPSRAHSILMSCGNLDRMMGVRNIPYVSPSIPILFKLRMYDNNVSFHIHNDYTRVPFCPLGIWERLSSAWMWANLICSVRPKRSLINWHAVE